MADMMVSLKKRDFDWILYFLQKKDTTSISLSLNESTCLCLRSIRTGAGGADSIFFRFFKMCE
jgi:uncharacterized protein YpiB (UPF0302 family)